MLPPLHPLHLALGPLLWCLWFVALYGGLSVGCNLAPPPMEQGAVNWLNGSLLLLSIVVVAALVFLGGRCWRAAATAVESQARFIARVAAGIYLLAAGSALAIGLPVLVLPPCV